VARSSIITAKMVCGSCRRDNGPISGCIGIFVFAGQHTNLECGLVEFENSEGSSSCIGRPYCANLLNDAVRME